MSRTPHVSIVDDDESVREATKGLVRSLGYPATTFASAEEFLSSDHLNRTSCLITDVQMPGLSGPDLQHHLLAHGHRLSIIFVTAYPEERTRARVLEAGAVDFLSKPFAVECFVGCLDRVLGDREENVVQ